jgi:hypothetical protein
MLLTIEMTIFAIMHHFAFPWKPYDIRNSPDPSARYQGGTLGWRALVDAFNPWDIIKASARGFRWLFVGVKQRETDISYKEPGMNNAIALQRSREPSRLGGERGRLDRADTMDRMERQETGYGGAGLSPQVSHLEGVGDSKEYIPVEDPSDGEDQATLLTHAQSMGQSHRS